MQRNQTPLDLSLFVLRVSVGAYMLLAGWGKVKGEIDNQFGHFYETSFKAMQPDWMPTFLGMPYGYALPWIEVAVGTLLILGLFTRIVGLVGFGMLISFTLALVMNFNSIKAQPEAAPGPFNANYIQTAAYLLFALVGAGRWSLDATVRDKGKKG